MKSAVLLLVVFSTSEVFASTSSKSTKSYKVFCYFKSWAKSRPGDGMFLIENINPQLCTHLIYASYHPFLEENWNLRAYRRFNGLKKRASGLKTLIAFGGRRDHSTKYYDMVSNSKRRKTFVRICVDLIQKSGFDGMDLDWQYHAYTDGKPDNKQNFVLFLKELREAFNPHGFLLTVAVSARKHIIDSGYDIPAIAKYVDFINLMAYDFHGGAKKFTGHNAPLYARSNETEKNKNLNVDFAVNYWLSNGCPADKLILCMPLFGRDFSLQDAKKNGLDAPADGRGMGGRFTGEPGFMGYNEICTMLKNETGWTIVFEPTIQAPYAFKDRQWIAYDNQKSIYLKVEYLKKMNLGGGMVWSVDTDDFRGQCHGQDYPLLRTINEGLERAVNGTTTSVQENSITPEITNNV